MAAYLWRVWGLLTVFSRVDVRSWKEFRRMFLWGRWRHFHGSPAPCRHHVRCRCVWLLIRTHAAFVGLKILPVRSSLGLLALFSSHSWPASLKHRADASSCSLAQIYNENYSFPPAPQMYELIDKMLERSPEYLSCSFIWNVRICKQQKMNNVCFLATNPEPHLSASVCVPQSW